MDAAPDPLDLGSFIGNTIRRARTAARISERAFARRLGTNQRAIQRMEAGIQRHLDAVLASSAMRTLGLRIWVDANPPGFAGRAEQRDAVHAWCVGAVCRYLERNGWQTRVEVEVGTGRGRGWIDVLAFRATDGALLVIEVKTQIDDLGRIIRTLGWHTRNARAAATDLAWPARRIVRALVVLATADSEARIELQSGLIRSDFPSDGRALGPWIEHADADVPESSIALVDPRRRRRPWLVPSRSSGRRTPAPYRDYADAARTLTSRRARPR